MDKKTKFKHFLIRQKLNILVLVFITVFCCFFISQKEGYHMDELLSFELSNAEFTPWIVTTQPQGRLAKFVQNEIYGDDFTETVANIADTVKDVLQNRGNSKLLSYKADVYDEPQWITAEQFHDYLTTDDRDNFNYLSVYFNVKDDNHPPLHFMALHTVSSIFKGQVEPWMGCLINLFLILGICILFMRICTEIFARPNLGIMASILYACSMAGVQTLLLIRMYAMLTFWCLFALYLHMKKLQSRQWSCHNKLLIFVTVCGFLTQYYFVIFMLFLAAVTMALIVSTQNTSAIDGGILDAQETGRLKSSPGLINLLCYLRTMTIAAVFGLCIYPFSIADVLYSGRGVESVQNLGSGFAGMQERFVNFLEIFRDRIFGNGIVMLMVLAVLAAGSLLSVFCGSRNQKINKHEDQKDVKNFHYVLLAAIPALCYFLLVTKIAPYYADRYMMPIFPTTVLLLVLWLENVWEHLPCITHRKIAELLTGITVLVIIITGLITQTPSYLYAGYNTQVQAAEEFAADNCLCVYDGVGYYQNLIEFTKYKQTLMVTMQELLERPKDDTLTESDELVVLIENGVDAKKVDTYLSEEYGYNRDRMLIESSVHGDKLALYRK